MPKPVDCKFSTTMMHGDATDVPPQKEPKLSRARQIPEWEEYDGEIARFARTLAEEGKMLSGIVAADVNVLADVGRSSSSGSAPDTAAEDAEKAPKEDHVLRDEL